MAAVLAFEVLKAPILGSAAPWVIKRSLGSCLLPSLNGALQKRSSCCVNGQTLVQLRLCGGVCILPLSGGLMIDRSHCT
jgi:hypothetical protein